MKKQIIGAGLVLTALLSTNALADGNITVTFDGQAIAFDTQPQLVEGSVMVPMRKIFETVGAKVNWDSETKTVTAVKNAQYVKFSADNATMELGVCKDGKDTGETLYYADTLLDSAPLIKNGSMLVPARAVSEAFYYDVNWNAENNRVEITTPDNDEGWIYYSSWTDGGHMYKIDTNGQNRQILSENDCYSEGYYPLVHNDGYIYYSMRGENEGCLYRIKTDGTGEEKLTNMPVELIYDFELDTRSPFTGDCIYFFAPKKDSRKYTVPLYKLNVNTKELTQLIDKEIPSYSIRKYGEYIYFQYNDDRIAYYRIDADGEIIKVLDNILIRNFSIGNDRLSFINERDGKRYTAALDGSDLQEVAEDKTEDEFMENYDGVMEKYDDFFIAYRFIEDKDSDGHYISSMEYYVVDNDCKELFKISPPENANIRDTIENSGDKIYYSLVPKINYQSKKIYVDSLDELLGMEYISVSAEKVDGKYEIQTNKREQIKSDFESEVHCIDLDTNTDTIILKGYHLIGTVDNEEKLYLGKETADGKYEHYMSDLNGNNIEPQSKAAEILFSDMVNVNEQAKYGIVVKSNGKTQGYPNYNQY